ncbi:MAG: hypothetical protein ACJ8AD_07605 [Gemmatimonadaceae bacterium]
MLSVAVLAIVAGACHDRNEERAASSPADATPVMQDDGRDVRITTTGNEVDLALVGDTITSGLSEQTLAKARHETDANAVQGTGLGASIERMVKSGVQTALGTRVAIPLSALNDVRYERGAIVFDWKKKPLAFVKTSVNGKPIMESFSPEDAQRFVNAVRARKRARGI